MVTVSRESLFETGFPSVVCAPVYSRHHGLITQVPVGEESGLKHESSIHCDELVSVPRALLTNYLGSLTAEKVADLDRALAVALDLPVNQHR